MKFSGKNLSFAILLCASVEISAIAGENFHLPTPNLLIQLESTYLQETEVDLHNGGFGMVREHGTRYHGGIDISSVFRFSNGEPMDPIFAMMDGKVVHVNQDESHSNYGKYIVIEHGSLSVPVFTLYAHLNHIENFLKLGDEVMAGRIIGTMGRSSNSVQISPQNAHLHLEIGVRLGSGLTFQKWYNGKNFDGENFHGKWNGLNFVTIDPLPLLRRSMDVDLAEYIKNLPTAFVTRIYEKNFPDFLRTYPSLCESLTNERDGNGFDIEWTWNGFPKYWTVHRMESDQKDQPELLFVNSAQLKNCQKRGLLFLEEDGKICLGERFWETMEKIFGK
ncbi:MAG: M23 family metallopeptidase [Puniceicoccales bacterium]|jgi:hypothetical protein|nr:M23 family metallopeptidase [Puniceicoccales bacterium]